MASRVVACVAAILAVATSGSLGVEATSAAPPPRFAVVRSRGANEARASFVVEETGSLDDDGVAWASFEDGLNKTGWGVFKVHTNASFADDDQAYAAGMLEGYLTAPHIFTTARDVVQAIFKADTLPPKVRDFMEKQDAWTRASIKKHAADDDLFRHVGYVMAQYDGLVDGYAKRAPQDVPSLENWQFAMLNGVGDLIDLKQAMNRSEFADLEKMDREAAELLHARSGHCSALVKVTADYSDLLMGHSSWYVFANTNRIFKHYYFDFNDESTAAKGISFSSYPGFLESLDDFYMLSSGIAWTQTTNSILNSSVYDLLQPQSLFAWQRVRAASAIARSGEEWFETFRRNASGTYANQYMIVDHSRFEAGKPLQDGTLWVIEEMPGLVVGRDQTETLRRGYWPSFNVPFYPEIYEGSGYPSVAAKQGNYFTYELTARAKIFRRDHNTVEDLDSLKAILRSNDYLHDPFSLDDGTPNPMYAICSRGDLIKDKPLPDGCYDTKVTSVRYGMAERRAQIINGMTRGLHGDSLPAFKWSQFPEMRHEGLPPVYDFDFMPTDPSMPETADASERVDIAEI
ncbi:Phospholipase B [Hondaea fermentalgiana]|uniref:Phospholipase B-like n=1 Tax=Hondaea fermentalgiana TaxID=2315210 RepID=A0A2R5GBX8_9STRA|nr:Phospholipase B [Hondaea fermentalgiana]|eukprot:GBG25254.1 Phospholipase B [Hondaea fermentalgiana]